MTQNFQIDFGGAEFTFKTMNIKRLQLYQVYVQQKRFHMQIGADEVFYITDRVACPEEYLHLERALSDAILKLGEA